MSQYFLTRRYARDLLLILALLLTPSIATRRSPRLRLSTESYVELEGHQPSVRDEENRTGLCITELDTFFCSGLCCPDICCPLDFPFCLTPTGTFATSLCAKRSGKVRCPKSGLLGRPCLSAAAAGKSVCCAIAPYVRCTADEPFACVSKEGLVGCGAANKPGVECPDEPGACCVEPDRCCEGGCCASGEGKKRMVEALLEPVPAGTPPPLGAMMY